MSLRPFRNINRKKTRVINVGDVKIGGDNPISVQSMTNTLTTDVKATISQINAIHEEGADIVRVSCPDEDSTKALKEITQNVKLPIIADIHFQDLFSNILLHFQQPLLHVYNVNEYQQLLVILHSVLFLLML